MEYLNFFFTPYIPRNTTSNEDHSNDSDNDIHFRISTVSKGCFHALGELSIKTGKAFIYGVKLILKTTLKLTKESLKIIAIACFVFIFINLTTPSLVNEKTLIPVLLAPIGEEIFFRGTILSSLELGQEIGNQIKCRAYGIEISETDRKTQMVFRVRLSAIVFGFAHYFNHNSFSISTMFQIAQSTVAGLSTGYLKERTNSIVLPIIYHISNNYIARLAMNFQSIRLELFILWAANKYCWYKYATREEHDQTMNHPNSPPA